MFHHIVIFHSAELPVVSLPTPSESRLLFMMPLTVAGSRTGQVGEWSDQWKVLVYDKPCRNIISTLLHVTQLRKQGVTLHMLVKTLGH